MASFSNQLILNFRTYALYKGNRVVKISLITTFILYNVLIVTSEFFVSTLSKKSSKTPFSGASCSFVIAGLPRFALDWFAVSQPLHNGFQFCLVAWKLLALRSYDGKTTLNDVLYHNCLACYLINFSLQIGNVVTGLLHSPRAASVSPVLLQLSVVSSTLFTTRLVLSLRQVVQRPVLDVGLLTEDIVFHTPSTRASNPSGRINVISASLNADAFGTRENNSAGQSNSESEELGLVEFHPSDSDPAIANEHGAGD